jgi:hypothetical protein
MGGRLLEEIVFLLYLSLAIILGGFGLISL